MGLFFIAAVTDPTGSREPLAAAQTNLAQALQVHKLSFTTLSGIESEDIRNDSPAASVYGLHDLVPGGESRSLWWTVHDPGSVRGA
jgi:hypothetical protein